MQPKINPWADNKSLGQVESPIHPTVGDTSTYLALWPPPAFSFDHLVVQIYRERKTSYICIHGIHQGTKTFI